MNSLRPGQLNKLTAKIKDFNPTSQKTIVFDRKTLAMAGNCISNSKDSLFKAVVLLEKFSPAFDRTTDEIKITIKDLSTAVSQIVDFINEHDFPLVKDQEQLSLPNKKDS